MSNSTLNRAIKDTRATLRAREQSALLALQAAWTACKRALLDLLHTFLALMQAARKAAGGVLPFFWLVNHNRLGILKQQITTILTHYVQQVDSLSHQLVHDAVALGNQAAIAQLAALDLQAVGSIPPFHLPASLAWLVNKVTSSIASILMLSVDGSHPTPEQSIGRLIDELLWRGESLVRTTLYEVFRAVLVAMLATAGLGWRWTAVEDDRTCAFCQGMDGTKHPAGEQMRSHPGCRCEAEPILV